MTYNHCTVKDGDILWGCAYRLDTSKTGMRLKCEPVLGKIKKYYFVKLNKDGTESSTSVRKSSRRYADTKEECVALYNAEIVKTLSSLHEIIKGVEADILESDV